MVAFEKDEEDLRYRGQSELGRSKEVRLRSGLIGWLAHCILGSRKNALGIELLLPPAVKRETLAGDCLWHAS